MAKDFKIGCMWLAFLGCALGAAYFDNGWLGAAAVLIFLAI
jgi:hypothetical protein